MSITASYERDRQDKGTGLCLDFPLSSVQGYYIEESPKRFVIRGVLGGSPRHGVDI